MYFASRQRAARLACYALALAGLLPALAGCAGWDLRGPGFKDEPKIGRKPVDTDLTPNRAASLYGFSTKARQIEQNLGVD